MATARKPFDWNDPNNLKERAWNSVKEFFGKEDMDERPLSPQIVAKESNAEGAIGSDFNEEEIQDSEESHADRIHRRTEQRVLNEKPTIWPG